MFFGLMILWIIFNGKITLEIVIIGAIVSLGVELLSCKMFDKKFGREFKRVGKVLRLFPYYGKLLSEIIVCSVQVIKFILSGEEVCPRLVYFRSRIKDPDLRVLMANSITLTPGTITVGLTGDLFRVHGLDKSFTEGLDTAAFEIMLEKLEEKVK